MNRKQARAAAKASPFAQAVQFHQQGDLAQAEVWYRKTLAVTPRDPSSLNNLGLIAFHQKRMEEAARLFEQAAQVKPDYADAHFNLGGAYRDLGRLDEAAASLDKALSLRPTDASGLTNLGLVRRQQGRLDEAKTHFAFALAQDPQSAQARFQLANILMEQNALAEAVEQFTVLLTQYPRLVDVWVDLGTVQNRLGRADEAVAHYGRALSIQPDHVAALYNLGSVLQARGRLTEAAEQYRRALSLRPTLIEAHMNLGLTLMRLGQLEDAVATYAAVLALSPEHPDALLGQGEALHRLGRPNDAIEAYSRGIRAKPDSPKTLVALADLLLLNGRAGEAAAHAAEAVRHAPDWMNAWSALTAAKKNAADWAELDLCERNVLAGVDAGRIGANPFSVLTLDSTPAQQLAAAQLWVRDTLSAPTVLPRRAPHGRDKIRIGYLSADFRTHATAYLATGLFEAHDRTRFETIAYSITIDEVSEERRRLETAFDRFVDLNAMTHEAAAQLIHADEIDILVDLKGYTGGARTQILAHRPAPIQVNYLGYPGTMGCDFIDYILADPLIVPADMASFFSEQLVHLPVSYQPNMHRPIAADAGTRADHGLPESGFVFCSFNKTYKITRTVFDIWMRLLRAVPGSALWLLDAGEVGNANLRREADARRVDSTRLVFAPIRHSPDHLARHRHADLFLDTLPVCAHTTASDALWAGLPLVSCAGPTFISRVSASLLAAVGLPEMITQTLAEYEALALHLAQNPGELGQIRQRLSELRLSSPLFDTGLVTRHIEAAYEQMWRRHRGGDAPAPFAI